jgi:hypothetical protein
MKTTALITTILFLFAGSMLFAADEKAASATDKSAADKPADSKAKDVKKEKIESKIAGRWEGKISRPDAEEITVTYTFKVDGEKLTGTVNSPRGERTIEKGKVKGDELSFEVAAGDNVMTYAGKLADGKMKMKVEGPWGEREMTLTRVVSIAGKWQTKTESPDGQEMIINYNFKVDGDKLTGTIEGPWGEMEILNGKIKGDGFTFDVEFGENKMGHECKISGDEIKLKLVGMPGDREFILKRTPEEKKDKK